MKHPKSFAATMAILVFAGWMSAMAAETPAALPHATPPAELVQKANKGDVDSMAQLGKIYDDHYSASKEVTDDPELSHSWYLKAAQKGDVKAMLKVANDCFFNIYGVKKKDRAEGLKWFLKAANKGNVDAQAALGRIYRDGAHADADNPVFKQDPVAAEKWFAKAAAQGDADSQYFMSGYAKDPKVQLDWLRQAADNGNLGAQTDLGDIYAGRYPITAVQALVTKDMAKAVEWYTKAATVYDGDNSIALEDIGAQLALGNLYLKGGDGVAQDYKKAAEFYRRIIAHNSFIDPQTGGASFLNEGQDAYVQLGLLYRDGLGVDKNEREAARMFEWAARVGSPDGWYYLGQAFDKGQGVSQDKLRAYLAYSRLTCNVENAKEDCQFGDLDRFPENNDDKRPDTAAMAKEAMAALIGKMSAAELEEAKTTAKQEMTTSFQVYNDTYIPFMGSN